MSARDRRRGFAMADGLVALGVVALIASLVYPPLRHRAFEHRVARVVSDVEAVRGAAVRYREAQGHWPGEVGAGIFPGDLTALLPEGTALQTPDYTLGWSRWDVVEVPPSRPAPPVETPVPTEPPPPLPPGGIPAPPPGSDTLGTRPPYVATLGGITVHSVEEGVLGALLERYGSATSFVRDSTWTLVLGPPETH